MIEKIDKKKKNMGRRKKKKIYRTKSIHNKFNKDNIVRKIKIHFLNAGIEYINKKYKEFKSLKLKPTKQKFLQKLEQKYTDYATKKEEKVFLSLILFFICLFSTVLSSKFISLFKFLFN